MIGFLMADSSSKSYLQAGALSLKYISSSFSSIPGFLVGFRVKSSSESESLRSPTTPLEVQFCSNLSKPFSLKSHGNQKKLDSCGEVGLAIINSVPNSEILYSLSKKNVIFGPQVKTKIPNAHKDAKKFITNKDKTSTISASSNPSCSSVVIDYSKEDDSLTMKSNSDPIDIDANCVGSLSAREIELSEDYTCIISHGPNPKTTHIFSDCILECHTNDLKNFGEEETPVFESPQVANGQGVSNVDPSESNLSFHILNEKNVQEEEDILIYSSESMYLEDENEKTSNTSCGSFSSSSFNEDLFPLSARSAF